MKKILMAVGLMLVLVSGVFAQAGKTNFYQYVETVDADTGVREKQKMGNVYFTFTNNSCYVSDERGIKNDNNGVMGAGPYVYQGEQNNMYVYVYKTTVFTGRMQGFNWVYDPDEDNYLYFSKDFKRFNLRSYSYGNGLIKTKGWSSLIFVYQQADSPSKAPSTLY